MQWHSLSEFLNMGGYALYVWVSFGVTFGCMAIELFWLNVQQSRRQRAVIQGKV